jgi:hypothetical protein
MSLKDHFQPTRQTRKVTWINHIKPEDLPTLKKWAIEYRKGLIQASDIHRALVKEYGNIITANTVRRWLVENGGGNES